MEYQFFGLRYKQNHNAPDLFAFIASSNELKKICGVARKDESNLQNYQRALNSKRVQEEIAPFFQDPNNCSPTSIVISLIENQLTQLKFEKVNFNDNHSILNFNFEKLRINVPDFDSLSKSDIIEKMKDHIDSRLMGESLDEEELLDDGLNENEEEDDENEDEDEEENAEGIQIGKSLLKELKDKLSNEDSLDDNFIETLRDFLKPALVIDGQHRLFGASSIEEDIPFLVCALINPDWKEQVFQFTVINSKSQKIAAPFITSLAGVSLTPTELSDLQERLEQAGVKLWEVEVMQKIAFAIDSPFKGLIDFKTKKGKSDLLGYATMKTFGKAWYEPKKNPSLFKIMELLYAKGKKNISKKFLLENWKSSENTDWYIFYKLFWEKVKIKFEKWGFWRLTPTPRDQFMNAVSLLMFQNVFFIKSSMIIDTWPKMDEGDNESDYKDSIIKKYSDFVDMYLEKFEKKYFLKKWEGELNHSKGKEKLKSFFSAMADQDCSLNHEIYKKMQ